jgi:hypothetical protein
MTKRHGIQVICGLLTLVLTCCAPGGERISLRAAIAFVNADKTPVVNAPVYVVEIVRTRAVVTEVLKTDEHGRVFLEGAYCLPAVIAARGGQVVIEPWKLAPSYQVTIKDGDQPPPDQFAGKPDSKYLGYSRTHTDCG